MAVMPGSKGCRYVRGTAIEHRRVLCVGIDKIEFHCARLSASPSSGEKDDNDDGDDDRCGPESASDASANLLLGVAC